MASLTEEVVVQPIDIPSTPQKSLQKESVVTPSTCPGTPSEKIPSMATRIASLKASAETAPEPSTMLIWPGGSQPPLVSEMPAIDEKLWAEILVKFGASGTSAAHSAQHFEEVIKMGLDANKIPFPKMPSREFVKICMPLGEPEGSVQCQDIVPFPFLQEVATRWSSDSEKVAIDALLAGRAKGPDDLRNSIYLEKPLDMELTPWQNLPDGAVAADDCTEAQLKIWEMRCKHPLSPEKIAKRRAALAKKLKGDLNLIIFEEARPELERDAAILEWRAARAREAAEEARKFDELAEQGAAFVAWVVPNARQWPEQSMAWKQHARWFQMWRTQPVVASRFAFQPLKRSNSTTSIDSWAVLSDVSWVELQSKASECGWQEVLDEQEPSLVAADPRQSIKKSDIVEIKAMSKPPVAVCLTMEVICILLQEPPVKVLEHCGSVEAVKLDYWTTSKKVLGDANFLDRVLALRDHLPPEVLDAVAPYMCRDDFTPEIVKKQSAACEGLCVWAREVYKYNVLGHAAAEAARQRIACKTSSELVANLQAAIAQLDKNDLSELKSLGKPPSSIAQFCSCFLHLFAGIKSEIQLTKAGNVKDAGWKAFQALCSNPASFLEDLKEYKDAIDAGRVPRKNILKALKIQAKMGNSFSAENMIKVSKAAAGLCTWLMNILAYYDLVVPKQPVRSEKVSRPKLALNESNPSMRLLSKGDIVEMKSFRIPPAGVKLCMEVICVLLQVPIKGDGYWESSQNLLADVTLLSKLSALCDHVPEEALQAVAPYMSRQDFMPENIGVASKSAQSLCLWIHTLYQHHTSKRKE